MNHVIPATRWSRLLDGPYPWGSFDVTVCRYGVRRYRLSVYPPGINAMDRRLVRLWRGWPVAGGVLLLMAVACVGGAILPAGTAWVLSIAIYLAVCAALFVLSAPTRTRVRSMSLTLTTGYGYRPDPRGEAMHKLWVKLAGVMLAAEDMRRRGAISPVEYEAVWWKVYDRMQTFADQAVE
jgi:hypothetical protein